MQRQAARQNGFTVTELLTTMALTAITASLAVPGMQSLMRESRQTTATNQMVASMHAARSTALTRNASVSLCASRAGLNCDDVAWEHGWIVFVDANSDGERQAEEELLETSNVMADLTMRSSDFDRSLTFRGNGQIAGLSENASTGRMTICDDRGADAARVLVINAVGKPRVQPDGGAGSGRSCPAPS